MYFLQQQQFQWCANINVVGAMLIYWCLCLCRHQQFDVVHACHGGHGQGPVIEWLNEWSYFYLFTAAAAMERGWVGRAYFLLPAKSNANWVFWTSCLALLVCLFCSALKYCKYRLSRKHRNGCIVCVESQRCNAPSFSLSVTSALFGVTINVHPYKWHCLRMRLTNRPANSTI